MSSQEEKTYFCDLCSKKLKTYSNNLNIKTSLSEDTVWSRLHIFIKHYSGIHNDVDIRDADLCKKCAIDLLKNAIERINKNERVSKGAEDIDELGWE